MTKPAENWPERLARIRAQVAFDENGQDENGCPLVFHLLKARAPADFLVETFGGHALHTAVDFIRFHDRVAELLEAGANPNEFPKNSQPTIHLACGYSNREVIVALLQAGADPNALDNQGDTAMDEARNLHNHFAVAILTEWHLQHALPEGQTSTPRPRM